MKYRLNYEKLFIAMNSNGEYLKTEENVITSISVYFEYRVYDRQTGEEIFFTADETNRNRTDHERYLDGFSLNEYFRCDYDGSSHTGYIMKPTAINKTSRCRVEYDVDECFWYGEEMGIAEKISHEKICELLLTYPDYFDTATNKPCQSSAFGWREVKEEE